jgi:thymidine phosphorylase
VAEGDIGLSEVAFRDLALAEGTRVTAAVAPAPASIDRVRNKLRGRTLGYGDFESILADVVAHRYSKVELSMFVLACALQKLSVDEVVELTRAMIATGRSLDFGAGPIADKHCVGGIPGNRTTMVLVPILAARGVRIPKTSSRAITSPAGTADTMGVLAEVALSPERLRAIVEETGGCIAWGGALDLAPADDILITVERQQACDELGDLFRDVSRAIDLTIELVATEARGPVGFGIGPRLEALDVLAVLRRDPAAPEDLREKSLYLAARSLELVGAVRGGGGYRAAQETLDSGAALRCFERIVKAQGEKELLPEAPHRAGIAARQDGRIRAIDCWRIARVAKQAGAPAHPAAGVRLLRRVGEVVRRGEPLYEIHAQSAEQLDLARAYAEDRPEIHRFGF